MSFRAAVLKQLSRGAPGDKQELPPGGGRSGDVGTGWLPPPGVNDKNLVRVLG